MWNPKEITAKFKAWCSICKLPINKDDSFVKDGQTNFCIACAIKHGFNKGVSNEQLSKKETKT